LAERTHLSIGEVLALLRDEFPDITISKIRFLESQGLLVPERTPSGYRKFYEEDVERLRWILRQQREHFLPLKVIKGRLPGVPDATGDTDEVLTTDLEAGDGADAPAATPAEGGNPTAGRRPSVPAGGTGLTREELAAACGLTAGQVRELERYGLLTSRDVGGTAYFDQGALAIAQLAGRFARHGVEARHLRMYKNAAERESGLFAQVVMPLIKQRNPRSRQQAGATLDELSELGGELREALLGHALRDAF
jgi:DNA-binding transcriptional MerR regulator